MKESWLEFKPEVASRYGSGARNDADVHAVEQAAEAGDEQEEPVVTGFGGGGGISG